ncbi:unnamed protein product [Cuscuta europaea]|uniref:Transposase (putative) gypsy type domain-containing protein n=1 Tax=Cuscuta europaea TaxID=41803 RepID=A0A9P1E7F6_CUSEU|nr:unnamed protein product [Cuscuta europaea]
MSSESDSQNISREPSVEDEVASDVESSSSAPSVADDEAVALELQKALAAEVDAEGFEQECEDEELALACQVAEDEAQKEAMMVTVAVPPPRTDCGEPSTSRPLDPTPLRIAPGKKKTKSQRAAPKKKSAADGAGGPVEMPERYTWLNTKALDIKSKADRADLYVTQLHVGPSAVVVEPSVDDLLSRPPEGCIAVHILSVSMGLRFPLHPFLREYLRFVGLLPCQLTPNSHSYIAGFLHLCRTRGVTPSLDLFFQSFNLCRGGHANAEGFANLQQVAKFKLFTEAPSSNKGWKDRWCYVRLAENPFPKELRGRFRRHERVGSAALEKDGLKLTKIPEGKTKVVTIKECTFEEDLHALGFRRYRFIGEVDEKYPVFTEAFGGAGGMEALFAMKKKKERAQAQKKEKTEPSGQKPIDEVFPKETAEPSAAAAPVTAAGGPKADVAAKKKKGGKGVEPPIKKQKVAGDAVEKAAPLIILDDQPSADPPGN